MGIELAVVSAGYFDAMGTPVLRGRAFTARDDKDAPGVVVVNQQMAEKYWPGCDAVGQVLTLAGGNGHGTRAQVIGIAKNGKYQTLGEDPKPYFYRPLLQEYEPNAQLIVRADANATVLRGIREAVCELDSRVALVGVETLQEHMQLPLFPAQAAGALVGMFGALALTLAIVGLYGVMSYSVSQRARSRARRRRRRTPSFGGNAHRRAAVRPVAADGPFSRPSAQNRGTELRQWPGRTASVKRTGPLRSCVRQSQEARARFRFSIASSISAGLL